MAVSPFTLSPNPAWLYLTESTLRSIEEIKWMVEEKQGLACIFGEVGMGKSSLLRYMLSEYADESRYKIAFLTRVDFSSPFALTKQICAQFDLPPQRSLAGQNSLLEDFLLEQDAAGMTMIVAMDEGQQLSYELLEVIRNLLNFETTEHKLIQIIVAGQMELRDRIAMKRARAFASRVFSPVMMRPLTETETPLMIRFRCDRVRIPCPFTEDAITTIHSHTNGVPRQILQTCMRAVKQFPGLIVDAKMMAEVVQRAEAQLQATA
jgi:general secretion pathway protein A